MAGRFAALARSRKAQPISNPLGKFDITELWNDEQDDAGCKSLLSEMLAELDVLISGDALTIRAFSSYTVLCGSHTGFPLVIQGLHSKCRLLVRSNTCCSDWAPRLMRWEPATP